VLLGQPVALMLIEILLRSSPPLAGRCWAAAVLPVPMPWNFVAILTGPAGPVLHLGHRDRDVVSVVAILTSPRGPVLPRRRQPTLNPRRLLRSSSAPKSRCCRPCARCRR
jgi:hypothetical protein